MTRVYIKNQGCQMNVYDSDRLADLLQINESMELVDSAEEADVLLLNTCAIREKSQEKVFSEIGRWNQLKKAQPHKIIGVGGCVASQEGDAIIKRAPYVDLVFGPQTLHRVPELLKKSQKHQHHTQRTSQKGTIDAVDITFPSIEKFDKLPEPSVKGPEAFVSIMEGCSKYCSFCVVPYTRGEEISRSYTSIMHEVEQLISNGVREIHLLGQNVNAWYEKNSNGAYLDLAYLIRAIAAIDRVARIRYTTSHPLEVSDSLIECYSDVDKLVTHLHLPVQSGSDRILKSMKRNYTAKYYLSLIEKLRAARANLPISSDFIVGFPGETEEDFQATMELIREVDFDVSFSFLYSARPGTPASKLEDNTPIETKKLRLQQLQQQLNNQSKRHAEQMLGSKQSILVSDFSKKSLDTLQGRTENNRITHLNLSDPMLIGKMLEVKITKVYTHSLIGEITQMLD